MDRIPSIYVCFCGLCIMTNFGCKPSPRVSELVKLSSAKESASETELVTKNPLIAEDVPEAIAFIKANTSYKSYLLLYAIRKYYAKQYKTIPYATRAKVLCSALQNLRHLNDWGYLDRHESYDGESAKALIAVGKASVKYLLPILGDESSARLWGSKLATRSSRYKYRRKDYAYRYILIIHGKQHTFDEKLNARDKRIRALKAELNMRE